MLRSGWSLKSTAIAIDVGPYGEGHQHEDKLSIQVWSHGKDLIGEAGLVDYAKSTKREYSLGTLAHSSAIIDGQQQNRARQFKEGARPLDTLVKATYDLMVHDSK